MSNISEATKNDAVKYLRLQIEAENEEVVDTGMVRYFKRQYDLAMLKMLLVSNKEQLAAAKVSLCSKWSVIFWEGAVKDCEGEISRLDW
jgi:hypothetical protein